MPLAQSRQAHPSCLCDLWGLKVQPGAAPAGECDPVGRCLGELCRTRGLSNLSAALAVSGGDTGDSQGCRATGRGRWTQGPESEGGSLHPLLPGESTHQGRLRGARARSPSPSSTRGSADMPPGDPEMWLLTGPQSDQAAERDWPRGAVCLAACPHGAPDPFFMGSL